LIPFDTIFFLYVVIMGDCITHDRNRKTQFRHKIYITFFIPSYILDGEKMACYIVPIVAAVSVFVLRKFWEKEHNIHSYWLNIMLFGGATFGFVDHLWNGELFLIGENILMDISLGLAITITMVIIWAVMVLIDKSKTTCSQQTIN